MKIHHKIKNKIFKKRFLLKLFAIGILIELLLIIFVPKFFEQGSPTRNIFVTNITDSKATISWTTLVATKGILILSEANSFPLLPFLAPNQYVDDREKGTGEAGVHTTHYVTLTNLMPETDYYFRIYQGLKVDKKGYFKTPGLIDAPSEPKVVTGKVISSQGSHPIPGAIIYFQVGQDASSSALLSTLSGRSGDWALDISQLRTSDLNKFYDLTPQTPAKILVEGGGSGTAKLATDSATLVNWPDAILNLEN